MQSWAWLQLSPLLTFTILHLNFASCLVSLCSSALTHLTILKGQPIRPCLVGRSAQPPAPSEPLGSGRPMLWPQFRATPACGKGALGSKGALVQENLQAAPDTLVVNGGSLRRESELATLTACAVQNKTI